MPKLKLTYLKPDFYDDFSCVGGDCRNNCCHHNWRIDIDKKMYKYYKSIKDSDMKGKVDDYIIRNKQATSPKNYAFIKQLTNPRRCGFETENGLCSIHAKLGYNALCDTCKVYPRTYHKVENTVEHSLCVSCEVVAEQLLAHKQPIQFVTQNDELFLHSANEHFINLNPNIDYLGTGIKENYFLVKSVGIAILQNRDYSIENRLCHLMFFGKKLDEMVASKEFSKITSFCNLIVDMVNNKELDKLCDIKLDNETQLNLSFMLMSFFSKEDGEDTSEIIEHISSVYGEFSFEEVEHAEGAKITVGKGEQTKVFNEKLFKMPTSKLDVYNKNLKAYYDFMSDKEHFIENILVNEFYGRQMPFSSGFKVYENVVYLAVYYTVLRMTIATYLNGEKSISDTTLCDVVALYGKTTLHAMGTMRLVLSYLKKYDFYNMPNILTLIKGK